MHSHLETKKMEVTEELLSLRLEFYHILSVIKQFTISPYSILGAYDTFSVGNSKNGVD